MKAQPEVEFEAAYLSPLRSGELRARVSAARELLRACRLCPRECRVNRLEGELGTCRVGATAMVSSYGPHFGEESPLVGQHGSGTIFLTHCNLRCLFCQNYDISHLGQGQAADPDQLAEMMLALQGRGCHNINFVTPTHQVPQILEALEIAAGRGLNLPLVYNCGGYESLETLRLLEDVFDIYMPDAKYGDNRVGQRLSQVPDYWDRNREALAEMHRQVGDLRLDERGTARRGLLVRHLVLPQGLAGTRQVMEFLASLSRNCYVNVMAQYRPCYRAQEVPELRRPITAAEYDEALEAALVAGLTRLDERWALRLR